MSLEGKKFQVIDTMELMCIITDDDGSKRTLFTGDTDKAELSKKFSKIEVYSGIGQNKKFNLFTKPKTSIKSTIKNFDMDFFAFKNGVELDKTSKDTYFLGKQTDIATGTATIIDANRILSVRKPSGAFYKLVTVEPTTDDEVKIEGNKLTFKTDTTETSCLVSYIGTATKDNLTVVIDGKSIPRSCELILNTVAYDQDTEVIVGNVYIDLYKAKLSPDYDLSFELGKPIEIPTEFDIVLPDKLPTGELNVDKKYGVMNISEI